MSNVTVVDATMLYHVQNNHMVVDSIKSYEKYKCMHIPNSKFISLHSLREELSSIPNALPTELIFNSVMNEANIINDDHIVVYDSCDGKASSRLWWLLKAYGHENVSVLDGGLRKWQNELLPISVISNVNDASVTPTNENYQGKLNQKYVIDHQTLVDKLSDFMASEQFKIIDTRDHSDWAGHSWNDGKSSGHIPLSVNIPFEDLVDSNSGEFINPDDFLKLLEDKNVSMDDSIVVLSETGMSACAFILLMHNLGKTKDIKLYSGNWIEWIKSKKSPIKRYV